MNTNQSSSTPSPKKSKGRKIVFWVLVVLLGLVLCGLMALLAISNFALNRINRPDPTESYISESELLAQQATEDVPEESYPEIDPTDINMMPENTDPIGQEANIVNVLLVGQDRRPGEGRARSDSMILCSFNKTTNKIYMISFLRDLYVHIPDGYLDNRLNAAYALGGFELLDATLETDFGVQIDANIEVDFSGFQKVIEVLGGVDVYLTWSEANYLNRNTSWGLYEGTNHLNGEQALAYSRIRYLDSDFGRTNRQRNVLTSVFNSIKDVDLATAKGLVDELFPLVTTDMTNTQIISYVATFLPMLPKAELNTLRIPSDDGYYGAMIRGMSVLVPDMDLARAQLIEALGE